MSRLAACATSEEIAMSGDEFSNNEITVLNSTMTEGDATSDSQTKNSSRTSSDAATADAFKIVTAVTLHEYSWPRTSLTDRYFIQEQLTVFLDAKSFKRKYPDLNRRPIVDAEEREYLLKNNVVTEMQLNMGLSAVRAEDVYDLMNDYPEKLEEYKQAVAERSKKAMAVKQMELQAVKSDSKRLEEWRKKAMRSATEWNAELNRDRVQDRRYFLDMPTMVIQEPCLKRTKPSPTDFGSYPVALVSGQFQEFYKKYTPDELNSLPVNTVLQCDDYFQTKRSRSPGPITVTPEELLQAETEEANAKKEMESGSSATKSKALTPASSASRLSAEESRGEETGESCAFCQEDIFNGDRYVQCSKCGSCGHPLCMDMTDEMFECVKTYRWMCMECKPCSICSKLDEEDKMLFCDRCDRGYHTFCVGLDKLPSGRWVCTKFCCRSTSRSRTGEADKAAEAAVAAVVATPSTLKHKISLEETVESVTQKVLAPRGELGVYSPASRLDSTSSVSNSPQPPPETPATKRRRSSTTTGRGAPCSKCGAPTSKGRRRLTLCTKCLLVPLKTEEGGQ